MVVSALRSQPVNPRQQFISHAEWAKALREWAASHRRLDTKSDWSRESIYAGRGE
jgi:hypothetical protein